jgi:hypothetical protein
MDSKFKEFKHHTFSLNAGCQALRRACRISFVHYVLFWSQCYCRLLQLGNETNNVENAIMNLRQNFELKYYEAVEVFDMWQDLVLGGIFQSKRACTCKTWKMRKAKSTTPVEKYSISTIT